MKPVTYTATEPGLHTVDFIKGTVEGPNGPVPTEGAVVFADASNGGRLSIKHPDGTIEIIEDLLSSRDDWRRRALGR